MMRRPKSQCDVTCALPDPVPSNAGPSFAKAFVYTFGFVLMTPQLYINYKLKSVAHLPWRFLCYRSLNTVIDDLFAFVIRMPTMHRLVSKDADDGTVTTGVTLLNLMASLVRPPPITRYQLPCDHFRENIKR